MKGLEIEEACQNEEQVYETRDDIDVDVNINMNNVMKNKNNNAVKNYQDE